MSFFSLPNFLFQMKKMKFMLQVVNKPQMVEQAGRSTAENCLTVILTSLAMVRDISISLFEKGPFLFHASLKSHILIEMISYNRHFNIGR